MERLRAMEEALERTRDYIQTAMRPISIKEACGETSWDRAQRSGLQHALNAINAEFAKVPAEDRAVTAPQEPRTIHGGNVGATNDSLGVPFYLQPGQCEPEYDQGHSVVVWYDDIYDLGERTKHLAALTHAIEALRGEMEQEVERLCSFNCDAESSCNCVAHQFYRLVNDRTNQGRTTT